MAFPNETLTGIFGDLSPHSLASLALVSHRFNAVAERLLYSSVFLRDVLTSTSPAPWRTRRWSESILQRSHLVETIRCVQIRWFTDNEFPPSSASSLSEVSAALSNALQTLEYLETLEIILSLTPAVASLTYDEVDPQYLHPIERIIHGCSFPHLRFCSLYADYPSLIPSKPSSSTSLSSTTTILATFLSSLPSLRHLKVVLPHQQGYQGHVTFVDPNFSPNALPHLTSLRGPPSLAAALLPNRSVHTLALVGREEEVTNEVLVKLSQTRTQTQKQIPKDQMDVGDTVPSVTAASQAQALRSLDLSAISIRPQLLRNIATHLSQIEVLKIRLALRHTLHYAMSGIRLLTGLSSVLASFERLERLDLSLTASVSSPTSSPTTAGNVEEESALCREWRKACPTLRCVIFPSQRKWVWGDEGLWQAMFGDGAA